MKPTRRAGTVGVAAALLGVIGLTLLAVGILSATRAEPAQESVSAVAPTTPQPDAPAQPFEGTGRSSSPAATGAASTSTSAVGQSAPGGEPGHGPPRQGQRLASPDAVQAAAAFMTAYRRPTPDRQQQWWAGVRLYLSQRAAQTYHDQDPATIPFTAVTGPPGPVTGETGQDIQGQVLVAVPTDAGIYLVQLAADPPHQVELLIRAPS